MFTLKQRHLLIWKLKQKVEASKISAVQLSFNYQRKMETLILVASCQQGQIMNSNVRLITECPNGCIV